MKVLIDVSAGYSVGQAFIDRGFGDQIPGRFVVFQDNRLRIR